MQTHKIGMSYDQNLDIDIRHITDISFTFVYRQLDYSNFIEVASEQIVIRCQTLSHITGLGQMYDLVIKVSQSNEITKVKSRW